MGAKSHRSQRYSSAGGYRLNYLTSPLLAFDTTDTVIVGSGTIDLRDEKLDLELKPRPKDISLISLRGPLEVTGTFKDPEFLPKPAPLAGRVAAAAALFAIAPPAALLALFETGPGKDRDCSDPTEPAEHQKS